MSDSSIRDWPDDKPEMYLRGGADMGSAMYNAAQSEFLRRATLHVSKEVTKFNKCSTWLAVIMIVLTAAITVLTAVMLLQR